MKRRNLWMVALAAVALLLAAQTAQAGSSVGDGAYVGIEAGFGASVVGAQTTDNDGEGVDDQTFDFTTGGLGMDGASYGAFMGYGFRMDRLYVGMEVSGRWTDWDIDPTGFSIEYTERCAGVAGSCGETNITDAKASHVFNGSTTGRLGWYLNPDTLFALSGGLTGGMFEVSWDGNQEEYWDPGITYGVGMESTIADGLAVRVSWNVVDYYDAEVFGIGGIQEHGGNVSVAIEPSLSVAHLGLMYTF